MAGTKISNLPIGTNLMTSSIIPIVKNPEAAPADRVTYRFTVLQMLDLIVIAGSGRIYQDAADPPVAPPPDPGSTALYYPNGGGVLYQWDTVSQTWV